MKVSHFSVDDLSIMRVLRNFRLTTDSFMFGVFGLFVVVDLIDEAFKAVDMVINRRFISLFEQSEVIGSANVFEIGRFSVLVVESFPDCWGIFREVY